MPEPWFASTIDGMIPTGTATVEALTLSTTTRGVTGITEPSINVRSPVLPVRAAGSAGFIYIANSFSNAWGASVTYFGAGDSNRIRFVRTGSNNLHAFQYWNGAAWVNIGGTFELSSGVAYQVRIDWAGYGTSSGSIVARIFNEAGEALVAARSESGIDFSAHTGIVQALFTSAVSNQAARYTAMFICDDNGDTSYVYTAVANQNGADTGGTGDFNSVNSTGSNYDSTFISLPTAGLRRSIKNSAARNYNARTVRAVSVNARLRCGASGPTRAAVYLTIGGTRYFHPNVQLLTTAFESYTFVWETNPATGAAWVTADAEAASVEWGVEARA